MHHVDNNKESLTKPLNYAHNGIPVQEFSRARYKTLRRFTHVVLRCVKYVVMLL